MVEGTGKIDSFAKEPEKTKILWEREFRFGRAVRERIQLGGKQVLLTTIFAGDATGQDLLIDPFFAEKGFVPEPTGLLIDQAKTKESWGRPAGFKPEEFLGSVSGESLGICPSNAGWQYGAFWIKEGELITPDRNLTGHFNVIGLDSRTNQWRAIELEAERGQVRKSELESLKIGFSFPLIVEEGRVISTAEIVGDPRLVADLRNVVDFAAGEKLPNDFWLLLRKLLPASRVAGERLIAGQPVVIRKEGAMTNLELEKFQQIVKEYGLDKVLLVDERRDMPRLAIVEKLPLQKIPVVGVGFDAEGKLIVTAVDGRQPDSAGVTIEKLANIMKKKGAVCAGLGCAGGDVAVVYKDASGSFEILNSPSNVDATGKRVTRCVPSLLVLQ